MLGDALLQGLRSPVFWYEAIAAWEKPTAAEATTPHTTEIRHENVLLVKIKWAVSLFSLYLHLWWVTAHEESRFQKSPEFQRGRADSGHLTNWASRTGGGSERRANPRLEPGPQRDRTLQKRSLNSARVLVGGWKQRGRGIIKILADWATLPPPHGADIWRSIQNLETFTTDPMFR